MKWLEKVKNIVHVLINKRKTNSLILNSPQDMYANLMSNKKIKDIINSVPEDLNKLYRIMKNFKRRS